MLDSAAVRAACEAQGLTHDAWFGGLVELREQKLVQMRDYDGKVALLALTQPGVWAYATRFRADLADLAAPLHGKSKDELIGDDVRQHRRAVRLARLAVTSLTLLPVLAVVAAMLEGACGV